jgi:hypothetical protein
MAGVNNTHDLASSLKPLQHSTEPSFQRSLKPPQHCTEPSFQREEGDHNDKSGEAVHCRLRSWQEQQHHKVMQDLHGWSTSTAAAATPAQKNEEVLGIKNDEEVHHFQKDLHKIESSVRELPVCSEQRTAATYHSNPSSDEAGCFVQKQALRLSKRTIHLLKKLLSESLLDENEVSERLRHQSSEQPCQSCDEVQQDAQVHSEFTAPQFEQRFLSAGLLRNELHFSELLPQRGSLDMLAHAAALRSEVEDFDLMC